jgi:hypothetical protein
VTSPESIGDPGGFLGGRPEHVGLDGAVRPERFHPAVGTTPDGSDVAAHPIGDGVDLRTEAVRAGEHGDRGVGPGRDEERGLAPAEGLGRAVRIAEQDQVRPRHRPRLPDEHLEQCRGGGSQLLRIVDDNQAQVGPDLRQQVRILGQARGGGPEQRRGVERTG